MKRVILALILLFCINIQSLAVCSVTICFTGDIMLDRDVGLNIKEFGMDYPYERVKGILTDADISFGNLECPLTDSITPAKSHGILFHAGEENAYALKSAGFDVLNLANNHILDYGYTGLDDTVKALNDNGMKYTGCSSLPSIIERHGMRIGFVGYSEFIEDTDEDKIKADIIKAKTLCDFLVASFHCGSEYNPYPTEMQKKWCRTAVDWGADLVVGHHPHVLQGMEIYRGKYIFYSLGNFIFDRQIRKYTDESMILKITVNRQGVGDIEAIPVIIKSCRPEIAQGIDKENIIKRFTKLTEGITPP